MALGFVHNDDWKVPASFMERAYPRPRDVLKVLARIRSHRSPARTLSPATLLGPGSANVPHLKWLMRSGALRMDPVLAAWIDDWPDREAGDPPAAAGPPVALTGNAPDLGPLLTARRQAIDRLRAMQRYCGRRGCRRMALLRYLGEVPGRRSCGSCDRCERLRDPAA